MLYAYSPALFPPSNLVVDDLPVLQLALPALYY